MVRIADCVSAESVRSTFTKLSVSVPGTTLPWQPAAATMRNAETVFKRRAFIFVFSTKNPNFITTSTRAVQPTSRTVCTCVHRRQCSSPGARVSAVSWDRWASIGKYYLDVGVSLQALLATSQLGTECEIPSISELGGLPRALLPAPAALRAVAEAAICLNP